MTKIINFEAIREQINRFDTMANVDMTKPNSVFPQNKDMTVSEKMQKFFDVADGNPEWNV